MTLETGVRIGRYEIGRKLGQGGFGILYAAHDAELGREVALKFLRPEHAFRPHLVQRFLQEARAAARISHPGIVTVYESGEVAGTATRADGTVYIAMELLDGDTLANRLKLSGRLPYRLALGICRQIATALEAAHHAGIVHRDLKPQNVFLVADPAVSFGERVKVLDFGIAKLADEMGSAIKTHSMVMLGTPMYMSPEQCKSSARVDARSDIYALGCILFEMVCGKPPFDGDPGELIAKHQLVAPPSVRSRNPDVPVVLDQLIAAMLAKQPDDRPQTMGMVLDVIDECEDRSVEPPSVTDHKAIIVTDETQTPVTPTTPDAKAVQPRMRWDAVREWLTPNRLVAVIAVGAIVLGISLAIVLRGDDASSTANAQPSSNEPTKGFVELGNQATQPPPADEAPPANPQIAAAKVECLQAQVEKRWVDMQRCGERLEALDAAEGHRFAELAKTEMANELSMTKLQEALEANNLVDAKAAMLEIKPDSVFRPLAETLYMAAVKPEAEPVAVTEPPVKEPLKDSPAKGSPRRPRCNADALRDRGILEAKRGKHETALRTFEESLDCQPDQFVEKLALIAACNAKDSAGAKLHYSLLSPERRAEVLKVCDKKNISLPRPQPLGCDADMLKEEGMEAINMGQHAAALSRFEASLRCKRDQYVLQLCFMEAYASRNESKAKHYYKLLTSAQQGKFAQMCIREKVEYQ